MKQYYKPRSLTFWAGLVSVVLGLVLGLHQVQSIGPVGDVLSLWVGPVGPHSLIASGLGLIGLRRALDHA